jgi:macrolide-specific efflux system membrane fusion protein
MEVEGIASLHSRHAVSRALSIAASELDVPAVATTRADVADTSEPPPRIPDPELRPSAPIARPSNPVSPRTAVLAAAWILSLAAVALITFQWTSRPPLEDAGREPVEAAATSVVTVGYGNIVQTVDARGALRPRLIAQATAQASGKLVEISAALGDDVEEGQILARLDATEQQHRVMSGQLNLEMARNQLTQREHAVRVAENRLRQLDEGERLENGFGTMREEARQDLLDAQTELANLMLQIEQHEIALERDRTRLAHTEIRAPIAGKVIAIDQKEGAFIDVQHAAPNVVRIADLTQLMAAVEVPQGDVSLLDLGMEGEVNILASSRSWSGRIQQIDPIPGSGGDIAFSVLLDVNNADEVLYPGMTVEASFVTATAEDVLTVPVSALNFGGVAGDAGDAVVELVSSDGSTERRDVVIGIMDGRDAEVVSGLAAGDRVVARVPASPAPPQ